MPDGSLHGDNTDWLGIKNQLESRLVGLTAAPPGDLTCLLCGAGGTARAALYAFQRMGAKRVFVYNRTTSRAEALAQEFGAWVEVCKDLDSLDVLQSFQFVVDTVPGSSNFEFPSKALEMLRRCRPVVIEAAYIPRRTAFVTQALAAGCEVVEGVEMLFEQGCTQCEIWTGRPAPRCAIAENLLKELFSKTSSHPAAQKMEPLHMLPKSLVQEAAAKTRSTCRGCSPLIFFGAIVALVAIGVKR
jgi:pentafunctional AROM polypeptide